MKNIYKFFNFLVLRLCLALIFSGTSLAYDPGTTGITEIRQPSTSTTAKSDGTQKSTDLSGQDSIQLKLVANDTSLLVNGTVSLKAEFSGAIRPCTDSLCTGTLYHYINDVADTSDDAALSVTLTNLTHTMQLKADGSKVLLYTAFYEVHGNTAGTHSVTVRVNGNFRQFKTDKKDFDVMPADCTQKIGESGQIYMDCDRPEETDNTNNDDDTLDDDWPQIQTCTPEVCDGVDNDCDGSIDEEGCEAPQDCEKSLYHLDLDGDGYGGSLKDLMACEAPNGYVSDGSDCDDHNYTIHPGATEICDDGIDNNCDGQMNEGCIVPPEDKDQDGFTVDVDCDDNNTSVYPGAPEICDGLDNDCNTIIDDSESCVVQNTPPVITPNINESPAPTNPMAGPVGPVVPVTAPAPSQSNQINGGYMLGGSGCQLNKNTAGKYGDPLPVIFGLFLFLLVVPRWLTHRICDE